jgi:O-antigen/teichoic acid export membrane protein
MHEPDAKRIYSSVSTYVLAVLAFLVAALCAIAPDAVALTTTTEFHGAAAVTPWIALGVMFQGIYLVGSIGLIITRRTTRYPLATGLAAGTSVVANALLIPRYGLMGAAWANTLAYGTLAAVTTGFSWRAYPIPYEWSRLLRIALAGAAAYVVGSRGVPAATAPLIGLVVRPAVILAAYALGLFVTGFFHAGEMKILRDIRRRAVTRKGATLVPDPAVVEGAGEILVTDQDVAIQAAPSDPAKRV